MLLGHTVYCRHRLATSSTTRLCISEPIACSRLLQTLALLLIVKTLQSPGCRFMHHGMWHGIIGVIVNPSISGASCSATHVTQFATAACHRRQGSQHHRQGAQPVIAETLPLAPWLDVNNFRESPSEAAASLNVPSNSCDCASTSGPLACVQADANSEQFSSPICSPSLKGVSYPSLGQAASAQDETLPSFSVGIGCAVFIGVSNGSFMVALPLGFCENALFRISIVDAYGH
jgi:hypothetical protein